MGRRQRATWDTRIAVDRARTELASRFASIAALTDLPASWTRAASRGPSSLHDHWRLSEGDIARLRMVAEVHHPPCTSRRCTLALHRRELADAAGLPPSAPALDAPTRETPERTSPASPGCAAAASTPASCSKGQSGAPRAARLQYGVAEAVLRDEVARTRHRACASARR